MLVVPDSIVASSAGLVRALVDSGRWKIAVSPENAAAVDDLVIAGWLTLWDFDPDGPSVTFTLRGAWDLGLVMDGTPPRWMTPEESAKLPPPTNQSQVGHVNMTDLMAARKRAREEKDDYLSTRCDGYLSPSNPNDPPRNDGGHKPPLYLPGTSQVWQGPDINNPSKRRDRPCAICSGVELGQTAVCLKCDRSEKQAKRKLGRTG